MFKKNKKDHVFAFMGGIVAFFCAFEVLGIVPSAWSVCAIIFSILAIIFAMRESRTKVVISVILSLIVQAIALISVFRGFGLKTGLTGLAIFSLIAGLVFLKKKKPKAA